MNPHIKRLALQAGGSHFPEVGGANLEKFAELLIRECVTVANCPSSFKQTNGDKILRHFDLEKEFV
jgi:hypothetical protein